MCSINDDNIYLLLHFDILSQTASRALIKRPPLSPHLYYYSCMNYFTFRCHYLTFPQLTVSQCSKTSESDGRGKEGLGECAKTELGSISKQTEKQFQVYFENTHTPNTTKFTYYGSRGNRFREGLRAFCN